MSKFKDYDSDSAETLRMRDTAGQDRQLAPPPAWRRHRRLIIVALGVGAALVLLLVWLLRFSGINTSVDRSRLTIAAVERGFFVRDVAADGQVVAASSPTLYAIESGIISLRVHAGDAVKKGQLLAVIDSPDLTAKLSQEQASLESMRVDWQRAQLDAASKLRGASIGLRRSRRRHGFPRSHDRAFDVSALQGRGQGSHSREYHRVRSYAAVHAR
jgi:multidrug efflux pump subunit AcrA (membrane-fusion protein)